MSSFENDNIGATELHARLDIGDFGDGPDGTNALARMRTDCDHVHVHSWHGEVKIALAPKDGGELNISMTPPQARAMASAIVDAVRYADAETDADVVLKNGLSETDQ